MRLKLFVLLLILLFPICGSSVAGCEKGGCSLITPNATKETRELYQQLADMAGSGMLFGHHYSNVSGVNFTDWKQLMGTSDVKRSVSDYPAVFGFDFGSGFSKQLVAVQNAARRGGVVTISDHMPNPLSTKTYNHEKAYAGKEIASVLPGGECHDVLLARLDSIADFAKRATVNGRRIPIIYRPWHEHTGGWFWWGTRSGTAQEYCELWRFTVEYLRDTKGVDNFIYAFSPSQFKGDDDYELRNPGSDYFDIVGVDLYSKKGDNQSESYVKALRMVVDYAEKHAKVAALTEFGYRNGIQNCDNPKWFTEVFLNPIMTDEKARRVAFVLTWRNTKSSYWVPLKDNHLHDDFVEFYNSPYTVFLKEWKKLMK